MKAPPMTDTAALRELAEAVCVKIGALPLSNKGGRLCLGIADAALHAEMLAHRVAALLGEIERGRAEIEAAIGHMLNASIDLQTGRTKQTAIAILDRGMIRARAFLESGHE